MSGGICKWRPDRAERWHFADVSVTTRSLSYYLSRSHFQLQPEEAGAPTIVRPLPPKINMTAPHHVKMNEDIS